MKQYRYSLDESNIADISRENATIELYVTQKAKENGVEEKSDRINLNVFSRNKDDNKGGEATNQ